MMDYYKTCPTCYINDRCKVRKGETVLSEREILSSICSYHSYIEKAVELSNIKKRYFTANKLNYQYDKSNEEFKDLIEYTLDHPNRLVDKGFKLFMYSKEKGTGKTYTSLAIANEYMIRFCTDKNHFNYITPMVLYIKYGEWINRHREAYSINNFGLKEQLVLEIEQMKEAKLLILDDIGSGRITDFARDITYDVVDFRQESLLPIICTSNFSPDELKSPNMLGDMIMSRLMNDNIVLKFKGNDKRVKRLITD
jgi:DNA replication protein DnaC